MTSFRPVRGLRYAVRCEPKPMPKPKTVWAKAGLAFERKLAGALANSTASLLHNPWFFYEDKNGPGWCVPDIILTSDRYAIVIEVKLTYKSEAQEKLKYLYLPVVGLAMGAKPVGVVVAKSLTRDTPTPAVSLSAALLGDPSNVVQWLGRGEFPQ